MKLWYVLKNWFGKKEKIDPSMKYLIIGLGNMGAEYDNTRHNIGFDIVDEVAKRFESSFTHEHLGDLCKFKYRGKQIFLLKPSTFMNLSGKAVRYWVQKLQIKSDHWLTVVDEFQFDLGTMKLLKKGKAGGHNGLQNIEDVLQTSSYPRLRVGIGHDFQRGQQVAYVLGKWTEEQLETLPEIKSDAIAILMSFFAAGLDRTMNLYNKSKK